MYATRDPRPVFLIVVAGLLVVGLFGPWYSILNFVHWNGLEAGGFVALIPVVLVAWAAITQLTRTAVPRWTVMMMFWSFLAAALWGGVVLAILLKRASDDYSDFGFTFGSIGWGLWLYAIAAIAGVIGSLTQFARVPSGPRSTRWDDGRTSRFDDDLGGAPRPRDAASGRVGVLEGGRPTADLTVRTGEAILVGRDPQAHIRLSDPHASRRHMEIRLDGTGWLVQDLGSTNPARIVDGNGSQRAIRGAATRLGYGQLAIGDAVITLYPPDGQAGGYR